MTSSVNADVPNGSNARYPLMSTAAAGTAGSVDAGTIDVAKACPPPVAPVTFTGCAQDGLLKSETWTTNAPANVAFRTQPVLDVVPANDRIPRGSIITGAEVRVRHAEGAPPNPTTGLSPDTSVIGTMTLTITPGQAGGGSNGRSAGVFSIKVPACGDFRMPASNPACDFRFGYFGESPSQPSPTTLVQSPARATFQSKTNPCWADNTATAMAAGIKLEDFNVSFTTAGYTTATCDWYGARNRDLVDDMSTPEAWNNAKVELNYVGNTGTKAKVAWLDGIELTVYFRPPGTIRPLSGCLTIRAGHNPDANVGFNNVPGHAATRLMGVDTDWGARTQTPGYSDSSYTAGTNSTDVESCALIRMISSQSSGVKLHVRGMIYAPTAAVDLNGKENEAPFVTDGLIVRHLSTWRWRTGHPVNAFGEDLGDRDDRLVWLFVKRDGKTVARELVELVDNGGKSFGNDAKVQEFVLGPNNTDSRCGC